MTDVSSICYMLKGKNLLGFMPLNKDEYKKGDWDNAIALYIGKPDNPECLVLQSENGDYSMYDTWILVVSKTVIERDSRYKTIGERIEDVIEVTNEDKCDSNKWTSGDDIIHFTIVTKTKRLNFGHAWVDCHYPNSIWDVI